jgi:hypothetical protein
MQSIINAADLVCQLSHFYFLLIPDSTCDKACYIIQHGTLCKNPAVRILLWGFCLWGGSHVTLYSYPSRYQWHIFLRNSLCWATSRWTSGIVKSARMHRLEQSQQYTTFRKCSDQLGGPHSLLFNGYQGSFLGWSGWSVKLTTELHLVQSWDWLEIFFYSPIHLHGAGSKSFYGAIILMSRSSNI